MLINMKEMLEVAEQNHFAVGAFNATESSLFRWRPENLTLPPGSFIPMCGNAWQAAGCHLCSTWITEKIWSSA